MSPALRPWLAALAAILGAPAGAVTPEQAQALPVGELARLVLGEAGALMVDVDRPKWPACRMIACPFYTEEQLKRPPPLRFGLTFYARPFAALDIANRWTGACGVLILDVTFDERDELTGIGTRVSWGVPHGLEPVPAAAASKDFPARLEAAGEKCRAGADPRSFFVSDSSDSAYRVAIAANRFAEAARRGKPLPFRFKCSSHRFQCDDGGAESVAARFRPANIAQAMQVDCAEPHLLMTTIGPAGCYEVRFREPGETLLVEVADAYSVIRIVRVEYTHSTVVY
ncbi:MAG TPA: hypothetical protein VF547_04795 [Allosphingosinicella sp.]